MNFILASSNDSVGGLVCFGIVGGIAGIIALVMLFPFLWGVGRAVGMTATELLRTGQGRRHVKHMMKVTLLSHSAAVIFVGISLLALPSSWYLATMRVAGIGNPLHINYAEITRSLVCDRLSTTSEHLTKKLEFSPEKQPSALSSADIANFAEAKMSVLVGMAFGLFISIASTLNLFLRFGKTWVETGFNDKRGISSMNIDEGHIRDEIAFYSHASPGRPNIFGLLFKALPPMWLLNPSKPGWFYLGEPFILLYLSAPLLLLQNWYGLLLLLGFFYRIVYYYQEADARVEMENNMSDQVKKKLAEKNAGIRNSKRARAATTDSMENIVN